MNIKQAKEEVKHTFLAYTKKKETGEYQIPFVRQRPVLLMGPPGIGKTAVVAQAAQELGAGFVSYTMTHHTRQSAVGLPLIREQKYGGRDYSVTEYTMSEIISSVYEQIEMAGRREGILFLDEINCVSETLAPTMLQFLQCKKFCTHSLPEGWVIVAAGNPPQYNQSVREFDLVTLDRVKRIDICEEYSVWKEYAASHGIHSVILSFLDLKKDAFYQIERRPQGMAFVTARGWEDLSAVLSVYEEMGIEITEDFLAEYIRIPETAADFKNYYELYRKYRNYYHIDEIVKGHIEREEVERLRNAPFDEAVSVIGLFLARLQEGFSRAAFEDGVTQELHKMLKFWKGRAESAATGEAAFHELKELISALKNRWKQCYVSGFQDSREKEILFGVLQIAGEYENLLSQRDGFAWDGSGELLSSITAIHLQKMTGMECFETIKQEFAVQVSKRNNIISEVKSELDAAFDFMEEVFHSSQEMVIFITELSSREDAVNFIMENGCEKFYRYNEDLLFYEKQKAFRAEISDLKAQMNFL